MPQPRWKCRSCKQNKLDKFSNFAVNAKHAQKNKVNHKVVLKAELAWKDLICINEHFLIDLGQKLKEGWK